MCECPECQPDATSALAAELTDLERQRQDRLDDLEWIDRERLALLRRLNPAAPAEVVR